MKWLTILTVLAITPPSPPRAVFTVSHSPFTLVGRRPEALEPLPFGAVRPEGWLVRQVLANLHGFTGHLDSWLPTLSSKMISTAGTGSPKT